MGHRETVKPHCRAAALPALQAAVCPPPDSALFPPEPPGCHFSWRGAVSHIKSPHLPGFSRTDRWLPWPCWAVAQAPSRVHMAAASGKAARCPGPTGWAAGARGADAAAGRQRPDRQGDEERNAVPRDPPPGRHPPSPTHLRRPLQGGGQAGRRPAPRRLSGAPQAWDQPPEQGARSSLGQTSSQTATEPQLSQRRPLCPWGVTVSQPQFPYP